MDDAESHRKRNSLFIVLALLVLTLLTLILLPFFKSKNSTPNPVKSVDKIPTTPVIRPSLFTSGIKEPTAIAATPAPTDTRLFVVQLAGTVQIVKPSGQLETQPFLDISQKVLALDEMGLLALAFHPNYAKNGYIYINYVDKGQNTVIARYKVSGNAGLIDPASEKVLFSIKQPYPNHNGGDLAFGPDGYLYITLGDGGSAGDPQNRAQDKSNFFGKILRIDVDKGDPYSVPSTNPFVDQKNSKPEIWAYGLRNPWRISFDKEKGDLFIADVGQDKFEEVNFQSASSKGEENYGWRCFEGTESFNSAGCLDITKYSAPILAYTHDEDRCSVTGGYVYRGEKFQGLKGKYFYGDFCSGQLYYASQTNSKWTQSLIAKTPYMISAFGQDSHGELYFADYTTGSLYQIRDVSN